MEYAPRLLGQGQRRVHSGGANESTCSRNNNNNRGADGRIVATSAEVPMNEATLVATASKVRKILSIEPITATEVPIVTTRPEMPMDE